MYANDTDPDAAAWLEFHEQLAAERDDLLACEPLLTDAEIEELNAGWPNETDYSDAELSQMEADFLARVA